MRKIFVLYFISALLGNRNFAQNVGIGTTAPVTKLNIVGTGSNPAIPGGASGALLRLGISSNQEGIDFGKMSTSPFSGWMQAGFNAAAPDPLALQPLGGNVGIGTVSPAERLDVNGNINFNRVLKGNGNSGTAGKVLTSNGAADPTWEEGNPKIDCTIGMTGNYAVPLGFSIIPFNDEMSGYFDDGNVFDNAGHFFTATTNGVYTISASINIFLPPAGNYEFNLRTASSGGNSYGYEEKSIPAGTNRLVLKVSVIRKMNLGDRIYLFFQPPALCTIGNDAATFFSAAKLY